MTPISFQVDRDQRRTAVQLLGYDVLARNLITLAEHLVQHKTALLVRCRPLAQEALPKTRSYGGRELILVLCYIGRDPYHSSILTRNPEKSSVQVERGSSLQH